MSFSNKSLTLPPVMIREAILNRIKEKDLSIRKCAIDNDFNYKDFHRFLKGGRPYPLDKIEQVLKYLELEVKPG